ncbi:MAG: hypothetical protein MK100_09855, partial [Phycisphaerales bacterium]|nr:hypothetical protein [Phycisphaerales bacterium]
HASTPQRRPTIDPIRVLRQHVVGLLASLIVGGVVGVVAFFGFNRFYPLYTSEILFEVRPGLAESTEIGTSQALEDDEVERIARTQTELLMQRDVLMRAVQNPQVRETSWMQTWFMDTQTGQPLYAQAVDDLEEYLKTPFLRGTNLFVIRWSWHDPQDVPKVLNAIAQAYTRKIKQLDDQQFSANEQLFDDVLQRLSSALVDLGDEMQSFIISEGITTLEDPRYSQTAIEVETLSTNLTEQQEELTSATTRYEQVALKLEGSLQPTHEDIQLAAQDPTLIQQNTRLEILRGEERALREQYNENTPQVRSIERQVRGVAEQIRMKEEEILHRNLNAQLKLLSSDRERLQRVIDATETELETKDALLRDLAADTSRYKSLTDQQDNLERQRDDAQQLLSAIRLMKLRTDASRVRQVGPADLPRDPSFPEIEYIIPGGVLLCFGLYLGWVFLRELTEQRVRSLADLSVIPGVTVLGAVADIEDDPIEPDDAELILRSEPASVTAESVRQVASTLMRAMGRQGHTTLMVAGGMPGAGSTTIVGNVATAFLSQGHRVCVVDANFRRPRLAQTFGIADDSSGLGELLLDATAVDASVHESESGVSVVPAGAVTTRLTSRLGDERFGAAMAALRSKFDYVFIDVAPAVAATDAMNVAGRV